MTEVQPKPPEHVYRGIVLPVPDVTPDFLQHDLVPPHEPIIDSAGRKTVADGNEYGVYMSDNRHMVEVAYADPRHPGPAVPESPEFRLSYTSPMTRLHEPRAAIVYKIRTEGIEDIRKPWITDYLNGVYNNGFQGNEWVADRVPQENYTAVQFRLGRDALAHHQDFYVQEGQDPMDVLADVQAVMALRRGQLVLAASKLHELTQEHRQMPHKVEKVLSPLREPRRRVSIDK